MNPSDAKAHLETVKDRQQAFKSEVMRLAAVMITRTALHNSGVWPDDYSISQIASDDRNCIGSAYRWLRNAGIIEMTDEHRSSTAEGAKGRIIFKWRLKDEKLARAFLARNDRSEEPHTGTQQEMPF
jgi:hypothetical protein